MFGRLDERSVGVPSARMPLAISTVRAEVDLVIVTSPARTCPAITSWTPTPLTRSGMSASSSSVFSTPPTTKVSSTVAARRVQLERERAGERDAGDVLEGDRAADASGHAGAAAGRRAADDEERFAVGDREEVAGAVADGDLHVGRRDAGAGSGGGRHLLDGDVGADALAGDDEHEVVAGDAEVRPGRQVDGDGGRADGEVLVDGRRRGVDLDRERTDERERVADVEDDAARQRPRERRRA